MSTNTPVSLLHKAYQAAAQLEETRDDAARARRARLYRLFRSLLISARAGVVGYDGRLYALTWVED